MIKVNADDVRELLRLVEAARGYYRYELTSRIEAGTIRLNQLEDKLRTVLGEKPRRHPCVHLCEVHKDQLSLGEK